MNLFLTSGCSIQLRSTEDNSLVGVGFTSVWPRDEKYETIKGYNLCDWHNAGAEIAHEHTDPFTRHLVWRNYQFQHIYNLAQCLMKKTDGNKNLSMYIGGLYVAPSVRELGLASSTLVIAQETCDVLNAVALTQSNFRPSDKFIEERFRKAELLDQIAYEDEILCIELQRDL